MLVQGVVYAHGEEEKHGQAVVQTAQRYAQGEGDYSDSSRRSAGRFHINVDRVGEQPAASKQDGTAANRNHLFQGQIAQPSIISAGFVLTGTYTMYKIGYVSFAALNRSRSCLAKRTEEKQ
jgi:hypothetical protein